MTDKPQTTLICTEHQYYRTCFDDPPYCIKCERLKKKSEPQTTLSTRFWRWLIRDNRINRVVRVKTLRPCWDSYSGAIGWPTLLVDRGHQRMTITPIWDKARYAFWRRDAGI